MDYLIRRIKLADVTGEHARQMLRREWLVTNGLGGYASGTISGSGLSCSTTLPNTFASRMAARSRSAAKNRAGLKILWLAAIT